MPTAFWRQTFVALSLLGLAILLINPVAEVGMNDDWSFIRTAFDLASTGHLRYNGWAAPMIGFQAYWGALFVHLSGYSFTVARFSTELLTLCFVPVLLRLCYAAGLRANAALFATLALMLSPLLLISITSFMTDTPAFLFFAGALLATLEAWKSSDRNKALACMVIAALFSALSGSIRQIYWAAGLWFLFVLAIWCFRGTYERMLTWLCLLATFAFSIFITHWQSLQPYVSNGSVVAAFKAEPWSESLSKGVGYLLQFAVTWIVLLLPVGLCFVRRWRWTVLLVAVAAACLAYLLPQPLAWVGNTLSQNGVLSSHLDVAGEKPVVLAPLAVWLIATAGLTTFAGTAILLVRQRPQISAVSLRFAILTLPFLLIYVAAIAFRGPFFGIYDRYSIPVIAILAVLLLSAHQELTPKSIPLAAWIALGIYALYGVATSHDSFSAARARLDATQRLIATGLKRTDILSGFEFDCWTEVDNTGYINNDQVQLPANAYHDYGECSGPEHLQYWWRSLAPSVHARYVITLTLLPDLEPNPTLTVKYKTWLPYGTHYVYAQRAKTPLTCHA